LPTQGEEGSRCRSSRGRTTCDEETPRACCCRETRWRR
jgi:hypothetical protein